MNKFIQAGRIELVLGPMFSGKSSEMFRRVLRHSLAQRKSILAKYQKDHRQLEETFKTVQLQKVNGNLKVQGITKLADLDEQINDFQVLGIDEGQFYPDLFDKCLEYVRKDKIIIISALDGTFERKNFGQIPQLIPYSDDIIKLNAICNQCGQNAPFTHRIGIFKMKIMYCIVQNKETELVGWKGVYEPLCRCCFEKANPQVL
ncbi:thymidine kinase [Stylonychia lemnae]|uniref:Thymidine kinase n=1 Tax=Stylonychia lemnae TaxID=5949 RepID=A0A077ZWS6_STYLE|nr:thymidine kinase [Stylonychia lemnae]|eukprot:CDW74361.1 thymidine kinase [Stylonychia lemnae]